MKLRAVAQLGRALRSGRRGRGFKSHQPDAVSRADEPAQHFACVRRACKIDICDW